MARCTNQWLSKETIQVLDWNPNALILMKFISGQKLTKLTTGCHICSIKPFHHKASTSLSTECVDKKAAW
jgi:hypothetical protein